MCTDFWRVSVQFFFVDCCNFTIGLIGENFQSRVLIKRWLSEFVRVKCPWDRIIWPIDTFWADHWVMDRVEVGGCLRFGLSVIHLLDIRSTAIPVRISRAVTSIYSARLNLTGRLDNNRAHCVECPNLVLFVVIRLRNRWRPGSRNLIRNHWDEPSRSWNETLSNCPANPNNRKPQSLKNMTKLFTTPGRATMESSRMSK